MIPEKYSLLILFSLEREKVLYGEFSEEFKWFSVEKKKNIHMDFNDSMSNDIKRMMANCFRRNLFRFTSVYSLLGILLDRGPIIDSYLESFLNR